MLTQLEKTVHDGLQPDLTLWFDVDPEVAAKRRAEARAADRFEAEDVDFFARVSSGYRARMEAAPQRIVRIDAGRPVDDVARAVAAVLSERIDG